MPIIFSLYYNAKTIFPIEMFVLECGTLPFLTDSTPTVVSGFRANITEFPWYATLYLDEAGLKTFHCGASIIKDNLLITAAHCVYDDTYQQFQNTTIYILTGNIFREYDNPNHNLIPNLVQRNQVCKCI